jgi:hypothetical protein
LFIPSGLLLPIVPFAFALLPLHFCLCSYLYSYKNQNKNKGKLLCGALLLLQKQELLPFALATFACAKAQEAAPQRQQGGLLHRQKLPEQQAQESKGGNEEKEVIK